MSTASRPTFASLDDLARYPGKAELIRGRIVPISPTGFRPSRSAAQVFISLNRHAIATGRGMAFPDNTGFVVPELPSGLRTFAPDASYHDGPPPADDMDFIPGPPTFAVEVRSKGDYGEAAEAELAAKRADYFEAGTLVVWDVDPRARLVRSYRANTPTDPIVFDASHEADAEPAVPGWRMAVAEIFQ